MRSMFVIAASAALLSLAAPAAHANEMSFGLKAGASIPMGDFKDAVGTGFLGGVYGDYGVTPQVAVGVDIVGNFYGESSDLKDAFAAAGLPDPKASITVIQFGVHGKWAQAVTTGPELQVGVGLYNAKPKDGDGVTKFGFNVGAGYKFWHNDAMTLGVEGSWHNITDAFESEDFVTGETTKKSAQYISVALDLGFLTKGSSK